MTTVGYVFYEQRKAFPLSCTIFQRKTVHGVSRVSSKEAVAAVTALAFAITENLSAEQSAFLAAIFTQLGDTITSILAGSTACGKNQSE